MLDNNEITLKRRHIVKSLKAFLKTPYPYIYLLAYGGVWLIWNYLKLPPHNPPPAGIIGRVTEINYNPSNNVLRFLMAIVVPPLASVAYWWLTNKKNTSKSSWLQSSSTRRSATIVVLCISVLLAMAIGTMQGTTNPANNPSDPYGPHKYYLVDTFHEGESLGPAVSYQQKNLKPYTDYVVRHGLFEDALRSVTAWKLFGRSIGAERTFTTLLNILVVLCYLGLLLILFKGHVLKMALGMAALGILMLPPHTIPYVNDIVIGAQLHFRDITTVLVLGAIILSLRAAIAKRWRPLAISGGVIGFIVTAGYANSVDTAVYATVLAIVWAVMVWLIVGGKALLKKVLPATIVGFLLGLGVLGIALKGEFSGFIDYMVATIRYNDYLDGDIFTQPDYATSVLLLSLGGILAAVCFWGIRFWESKKVTGFKKSAGQLVDYARQAVQRYPAEIIVGVAALICMRSAIGRDDLSHFVYSVQWMYLLLAYLLINFLFSKKNYRYATGFIGVLIFLFVFAAYVGQVKAAHPRANAFPLHVPDSQLVRPDYLQTADYLKQHLHGQDTFVTLTSEGIWYYLVDKPSPVQYPVIWYADTAAQRASLAEAIANNPHIKYILTNNNWTTDIDYVPNPVRFPEVYKVLNQDYVPSVGIGQQTLWTRK